ncbi:MAG: CopD family protein [Nitrospirae bacterium]|nr:CopD family protein [Nitrospirota bacterium]
MELSFSHLLTGSLLRALALIPLIVMMGWLGFLAVVVRSDGLGVPGEGRRLVKRWDRWLAIGTLSVIPVVLVVGFAHQSMMMSRRSLGELGPFLWPILTQTHLGRVAIGQALLWMGLVWVWSRGRMEADPLPDTIDRRLGLLLGLGALFCLTQSLTGHAADRGDWSVDVLADWFHLLAVSFWAGGVVPLALLVPALMRRCGPVEAKAVLIRALERFSPLAMTCVAVLVSAGLFNAFRRGVTLPTLVDSTYGGMLALKIALTVVAVGLGGVSRFVVLPRLRRNAPTDQTSGTSLFRRAISAEAGVTAIVILLAAILTQTPPSGTVSMTTAPMHHPPMEHQQAR